MVVPASKNAASKNLPKDILRDKNHLYRVLLVHLTSNDARKHLQMAVLRNHKNSKFCLTTALPDHICKPRCQMKHHIAVILWYAFWSSNMCGASAPRCSCYLPLGSSFSSSCSKTILLSQSSVSRCHNNTFKVLAVLQKYWTSTDILRVRDTSETHVEVDVTGQIYTWSGGWQLFCPSVFRFISTDET